MSSSASSPPSSSAIRCTRSTTSTSASRSSGGPPRTPSKRARPRSSSSIARAPPSPKGGTRTAVSWTTSTSTPPSPTVTVGPKRASRVTPTIVSRPCPTIWQTRTPSSSTPSYRAMSISSRYASRTWLAEVIPTFTSPSSVLCASCGPDAFITTGYPTCAAARTAAAALVTSCSRGTRIPYARRSCFAACSLSCCPGCIRACALRNDGDGVRGASSNGEE